MTIPATNTSLQGTYCYTQYPLGATTPPVTSCVTITILRKVVSLTAKNPSAIKARRQGKAVWLPPLPYNFELKKDEIQHGWGRREIQGSTPGYYRVGYIDPGAPFTPVTNQDLNDVAEQAEIRALNKLKNQNVNFAQFFAETEQTVALLGNTATSLASALRKTKKGNIVGALKALGFGRNNRVRRKAAAAVKREAKAISRSLGSEYIGSNPPAGVQKAASNWLAMQFGWLPLLSDLQGSAKLLADRATQDPQRARFSVRAVVKRGVEGQSRSTYISHVYNDNVCRGNYGAFVRLDFHFSSVSLASANADGLTNPASLAWEVTPFSFLSDYVINIGGYLENLDSTFGKAFVGGSVTRFQNWTSRLVETYDYKTAVTGSSSRVVAYKRVTRAVYGSFPDASMHTLQVRNPLKSAKRIANSCAILVQAVADFQNH